MAKMKNKLQLLTTSVLVVWHVSATSENGFITTINGVSFPCARLSIGVGNWQLANGRNFVTNYVTNGIGQIRFES